MLEPHAAVSNYFDHFKLEGVSNGCDPPVTSLTINLSTAGETFQIAFIHARITPPRLEA